MSRRKALIFGFLSLAATSALAQEAAPEATDAVAEPSAEFKALADTCAAHKFETIVAVEGRKTGSRVRICGKEGQTDSDWLVTLRDSVTKTQANEDLAQPVRDQIVAALKAEIARLEAAAAAAAQAAPAATIARTREPVSVPEASPQYSSVPPLPTPKPRTARPAGNSPAAPKPRAAASVANAPAAPLVRPRLTIRCALPRETYATCANLERETRLMIRADEDLAAGTSVRFLRRGDARAELDVGSLKKGASLREKLPSRVCAGVLHSKVQVQILSKGQVAETLGPYPLDCGL